MISKLASSNLFYRARIATTEEERVDTGTILPNQEVIQSTQEGVEVLREQGSSKSEAVTLQGINQKLDILIQILKDRLPEPSPPASVDTSKVFEKELLSDDSKSSSK